MQTALSTRLRLFVPRVRRALARYVDRVVGPARLERAARSGRPIRLVVGASGVAPSGWLPTEQWYFDVTDATSWARYFRPGTVTAVFAEHVWEHLPPEGAERAVRLVFEYLAPRGYLRLAVPDGNHSDPAYIDGVRPGGAGPGADDHKVLYTAESMGALLSRAGFRVELLEWYDDHHQFHERPWRLEDGRVHRSAQAHRVRPDWPWHPLDWSLVVDGVKP